MEIGRFSIFTVFGIIIAGFLAFWSHQKLADLGAKQAVIDAGKLTQRNASELSLGLSRGKPFLEMVVEHPDCIDKDERFYWCDKAEQCLQMEKIFIPIRTQYGDIRVVPDFQTNCSETRALLAKAKAALTILFLPRGAGKNCRGAAHDSY